MNITGWFIRRPVATTLLTLGLGFAGFISYFQLPVSALPTVDLPTLQVQARLPGASPAVMATSVATPLERHLGQIADVSEMTSNSTVGSTQITLQFGFNRNIDGAARDVEAALQAARADLPSSLRQNPTYRKINPADAPILIMALTSKSLSKAQIYDAAATILQQKLSQIEGVGDVFLGGGANPAVRVELDMKSLFAYGLSPEDVRAAIAAANANQPKGFVNTEGRRFQIYTNDQAKHASDYLGLVVGARHGRTILLSDIAKIIDSVEDVRQMGLVDGKPAIIVRITRQPGANVIATVDHIKKALPNLRAEIPSAINLEIIVDRTLTTRASLKDVELSLGLSIILVVLVVMAFLNNGKAVIIPAIAVIISLLGALCVMYLLKYSLDILSLMALTIATGFVVDDAIVVLENITRHMENGMPRFQAALLGAREVAFTVIAISISLIAVFLPILFMGGIIGRFILEFGITLSASILVSLVVSLTFTPMMAARLGGKGHERGQGANTSRKTLSTLIHRFSDLSESGFAKCLKVYDKALTFAFDHGKLVLVFLCLTIALNIYLFIIIPKGLFPQQDSGQLVGAMQLDQASSFDMASQKLMRLQHIILTDKAVDHSVGFTTGSGGFIFTALKPKAERGGLSSDLISQRLRPKLSHVAGTSFFVQVQQEFRTGGRPTAAQYQYTIQSDDINAVHNWSERLYAALKHSPILTDVNSDQQEHGLEAYVTLDRDKASRLGVTAQGLDNILYDFYGQRQVATLYNPLNQYHVVMEAEPQFTKFLDSFSEIRLNPVTGPGLTALSPAASRIVSNPALSGRITNAANLSLSNPALTSAQYQSFPLSWLQTSDPETALAKTLNSMSATTGGVTGSATNALSGTGTTSGITGSATALSGAGTSRTTTGSTPAQTGQAISTAAERMIPLSSLASWDINLTPVSISHQGQSVAATISFNLTPGKSLSDAETEIKSVIESIGMPNSIHGGFQGTAQAFRDANTSMPILILAALGAVYIVLGILYESYVHPITVLSTLPSAGVGAVLALLITHLEFSIIALIGVILLIGIVKKNAILVIDFALTAERAGKSPREAIHQAALLRFRPIMMTSLAAILGAIPLAFAFGEGGEMRQPLGVAIIGGLIMSQILTLLTTPVVYLYMDRLRWWKPWRRQQQLNNMSQSQVATAHNFSPLAHP